MKPDLPGLLGVEKGLHGAVGRKDAIRIFEPNDLVMLHEIDVIGLEPLQGLVDLQGRLLPRAAVDLGHQKDLRAIAVAQGLAHADFALAAVIVPRVVQKVDAVVDGRADDADAVLDVLLHADVIAAQADQRDTLARAAQGPIAHVAADRLFGRSGRGRSRGRLLRGDRRRGDGGQEPCGGNRGAGAGGHRLQKIATLHENSPGSSF